MINDEATIFLHKNPTTINSKELATFERDLARKLNWQRVDETTPKMPQIHKRTIPLNMQKLNTSQTPVPGSKAQRMSRADTAQNLTVSKNSRVSKQELENVSSAYQQPLTHHNNRHSTSQLSQPNPLSVEKRSLMQESSR